MPIITRIYRTGSQRHYTIALDCGHKYVVENAMVKRDQLYVGKGIPCVECGPQPPSPARFEVAIRVYTVVTADNEAHAQKLATENLQDALTNYGENDTRILSTSMDDVSVLPWEDD